MSAEACSRPEAPSGITGASSSQRALLTVELSLIALIASFVFGLLVGRPAPTGRRPVRVVCIRFT